MASFNTLTDDFQDGVLAAPWSGSYGVTETGGRLEIISNGTWASLTTDATWSLANAAVYAQVTPAPATGATSGYTMMSVGSATDGTRLIIDCRPLDGTVRFGNDVGYWDDAGVSATYDPEAMRWWRIRETSGTVYLETSPDASTWTTHRQVATPAWATGETTRLIVQAYQDAGTSTAYVDNVNHTGQLTMGLGPAVMKMRAADGSWLNVTLRLLPLGYGPITVPETGIKPTNYTQDQLNTQTTTLYDNWKSHLRESPENGWWAVLANAQIDPDTGIAENPYVAEGQGYGLMILAQMAPHDILARRYFDGIVKYVLDHPSVIDPDLHAAQQNADMVSHGGSDSATDGDMDIAMGLLMGHGRWGSFGTHNYLELAKTRIAAIKRSLISPTTGLLELGDWSNGTWENVSRPSDWMIGHFEQFAWATGDTDWHTIRDAHLAAIARLQEFYAGRTGLLPDFTVNGPDRVAPAPADTLEGPNDGRYYYNACRVPWRLAAAQSIPAREAAARISQWSNTRTGGVPTNFTAGYYLNGTALNAYADMSFIAPLTVAASVAGDQTWLNALWGHLAAHTDEPLYYPASIQLLTMIEVAGTYKITPSTAVPPPAQGWETATVDVNANVRSYASATIDTGGTTTTKTFNAPSQIVAGDLLVAYVAIDQGTLPAPANLLPAGWTELGRVTPTTTGQPRLAVIYKVATASEPATYTFGTMPTTVRGSTLSVAVRDWSGNTADLGTLANGGFALSPVNNTTVNKLTNTPSVTPRTNRSLMLTNIVGAGTDWVYGWIPPKEEGVVTYAHQTGYFLSQAAGHEHLTGTTATGPRTWEVNTGSTQNVRMTSALTIPSGTATKTITRMLADQAKTLGSGGELTNRTNVMFEDSTGLQSTYHIYAEGLDWSADVGLMIYTDGSGESGLVDPADNYLVSGPTGIAAVARRQNMILLTPRAPGDGCTDGDGVCWYAPSFNGVTAHQKLEWSNELIRYILTQYDIDRRRIAIGGYSSGAQWTTAWFGPKYASEIMLDGVAVAISYGGQPQVTPRITDAYKNAVEYVWDTGDQDTSYTEPTWDNGIQTGRAWYAANGFPVMDLNLEAGVAHARYGDAAIGEYGGIMEAEIIKRVPPSGVVEPTTGLRPVKFVSSKIGTVPSTVTNKTILAPRIIRAGDFLLAVFSVYSGTVANAALPAGFTLLAGHTRSTAHRTMVGYKIATANEPASYTPTLSGTQSFRLDLINLGNVDTSRLGTPVMVTTTGNTTTHSAPSVTPTTSNGMLVSWISGGGAYTWDPPASMSEITDGTTGASHYLTQTVAVESLTTAAATGTRTFVTTGTMAGAYTQIGGSLFLPSLGS